MDSGIYKVIIQELLKLMDEGVYIVNKDGVGLFYNEAMAAIEQIQVNDVLGKEYHKAFPGVSPGESTMFRALKKGLKTDTHQQQYVNLYGREVTTINTTVPIKVHGEVVGALEVARDITPLKDMTDTILKLREESPSEEGERKKTKGNLGIRQYTFSDIIGENREFKDVVLRARQAATTDATVFIYGETGTGKELFAQSIHWASERKQGPFLAQNCAALPETLLEGILFGTTKGGFTGAVDRAGLFEQASGGTLLLDEVSAMPFELQGKLLRVLQEEYIRRIGGTKDIPVDTRIIATGNEDPRKLVAEGRLRKDLYYRLNVVNLVIPPLKSRLDDIPVLVDYFIKKGNEKYGKNIQAVNSQGMKKLELYDYPGNVRELENLITGGISMAGDEVIITDKMLQIPTRAEIVGPDIEKWDRKAPLSDYIAILEKEIIRECLLDNSGNISKAAEDLGIKRQTLQHKMKKYNLNAN